MYLDAAGTGPRLNTPTALPGWSVIFWVRLTDSGLQFGGLANDEVHDGADLVGQLVSVRVEHMNGAGFGQPVPQQANLGASCQMCVGRVSGQAGGVEMRPGCVGGEPDLVGSQFGLWWLGSRVAGLFVKPPVRLTLQANQGQLVKIGWLFWF